MRHEARAIAVFARAPVAGRVKTRLIPELGVQGALQAHNRLLAAAMLSASAVPDTDVTLWLSEAHALGDQWARKYGARLHLQAGATLGERMSHAFGELFALGYAEVLLMGCDCPPLTREYLDRAGARLRESAAVIAPAEDGGYGLIGLVDRVWPAGAALFEDVQWGTGQVMAQTRGNARRAGIPLVALPQIWDVDDARGWRRFLQQAP